MRAIDADRLLKMMSHWKPYMDMDKVRKAVQNMPTLTPQNEWVSVETPPITQGWYHVAVLDLKTGKYTVEQDLYSIELAKAHGFEPGFCKANRWEERERIDYWCRFPAPPDRRPQEGEEDNGKITGNLFGRYGMASPLSKEEIP